MFQGKMSIQHKSHGILVFFWRLKLFFSPPFGLMQQQNTNQLIKKSPSATAPQLSGHISRQQFCHSQFFQGLHLCTVALSMSVKACSLLNQFTDYSLVERIQLVGPCIQCNISGTTPLLMIQFKALVDLISLAMYSVIQYAPHQQAVHISYIYVQLLRNEGIRILV